MNKIEIQKRIIQIEEILDRQYNIQNYDALLLECEICHDLNEANNMHDELCDVCYYGGFVVEDFTDEDFARTKKENEKIKKLIAELKELKNKLKKIQKKELEKEKTELGL